MVMITTMNNNNNYYYYYYYFIKFLSLTRGLTNVTTTLQQN